MRKIFTLLTMCMLVTAAFAQTKITFVPGDPVGTQSSVSTSDEMTKDGITVTTTYGAFAAQQYRFGMNSVTTFRSTIGNIVKIEFTGATTHPINGFGENEGMSYSGNDGEWNGNAEEVVLTALVKQARATKIVFTIDGSVLSSPRFSPAAGTYFEPVTVTLSCATAGANIYYTTNGTEPTTSSTKFTQPFTLSQTTTVKAIAELNGEKSSVATASYVISSDRIGLGDLANVADDSEVMLGYDATVLFQKGTTMYLMDQTGYGLVYGTVGKTYKQGDVIAAGYGGTKTTYNAEPELKNPTGFGNPTGNVTLTANTITCSQVGHETWAQYVLIKQVVINMTDDNNGTMTDASGSCALYNRTFGAQLPTDGKPYDVFGIVAAFQQGGQGEPVYQILPIEVVGFEPDPDPTVGLGQLAGVADNKNVNLAHDLTVIYQGGRNNDYLYVLDETGFGLIYGSVGYSYEIGDIIPKTVTATKTTYKGEPELTNAQGLKKAETYVELTPNPITTRDVDHNHWAQYVLVKNATLSADGKTLTDANGSCEFYNGTFNIELPTDGQPHDWYCIVGVFSNYQLLPISYDRPIEHSKPQPPIDVENIEEFYEAVVVGDAMGHFTTNLTAIYQNGSRLYVQDVDGTQTLVYGHLDATFNNGDLIVDAIAKHGIYQEADQMLPVENFVPNGRGNKVYPDDPMPIEEISQDMIHRYLSFENVTIILEDGKYYMVDETGRIQLFDQFSVGLDKYVDGKTHYVEAFLTIFRGELELYPVLIDGGGDCGTQGDVNNDQEINIADLNALSDIILGASVDECTKWRADVNGDDEIGVGDVNALINLILGM